MQHGHVMTKVQFIVNIIDGSYSPAAMAAVVIHASMRRDGMKVVVTGKHQSCYPM